MADLTQAFQDNYMTYSNPQFHTYNQPQAPMGYNGYVDPPDMKINFVNIKNKYIVAKIEHPTSSYMQSSFFPQETMHSNETPIYSLTREHGFVKYNSRNQTNTNTVLFQPPTQRVTKHNFDDYGVTGRLDYEHVVYDKHGKIILDGSLCKVGHLYLTYSGNDINAFGQYVCRIIDDRQEPVEYSYHFIDENDFQHFVDTENHANSMTLKYKGKNTSQWAPLVQQLKSTYGDYISDNL